MEFILPLVLAFLSVPMPWQFHVVQLLALVLGLVAVNPSMRFSPGFLPFRFAAAMPKTRVVFLAGTMIPVAAALAGILFLRSWLVMSLDIWKFPLVLLECSLLSACLFHAKGLFYFLEKGAAGALPAGEDPVEFSRPCPLFLYLVALARFADLGRLGFWHPDPKNGRIPKKRYLARIWQAETSAALEKLGYHKAGEYPRAWRQFMGLLPGSLVAMLPFIILPLAGFILPFLN